MNEFDVLRLSISIATKHARHNQKAHGRRGGEAGSAGAGGDSPPDDAFAAEYKAKVAASHQRAITGLNSDVAELQAELKLFSDITKINEEWNRLWKLRETLPPGNDRTLIDNKIARLAKKQRKLVNDVKKRINATRSEEAIRNIISQKQNIIRQLEAELVNMPDRPLGWPSVQVAREAAALRAKYTDAKRLMELADQKRDEASKIFNGTDMVDLFEERSRLKMIARESGTNEEVASKIAEINRRIKAEEDRGDALEKESASLRAQANAALPEDGRTALLESLKSRITTGEIAARYEGGLSPGVEAISRAELAHSSQFFDRRLLGADITVKSHPEGHNRSAYSHEDRSIYVGKNITNQPGANDVTSYERRVFAHEFAHSWDRIPDVGRQSIGFLERRTAGNPEKIYQEGEKGREIYRDGGFYDNYVGKIYRDRRGDYYASEVLSMGFDRMRRDPAAFAAQDPDHFDFVYSIMVGDW